MGVDSPARTMIARAVGIAAACLIAFVAPAQLGAGVLPEDRADLLYHRYDGGGVTIDGPSVLVRKKFGDKLSVAANYYVDMVSSASIDVVTTASPYEEERTQYSVAADVLRGKSTYSFGYIDSSESDYNAKTAYASISQDMFGDLTTISFSFRRGWNDVYQNINDARDPSFAEQADTRAYAAGITQVITRSLIGTVNYEVITDEGFLNSPYRSVRYADPVSLDGKGYSLQDEIYPRTRTSNAASARLKYFLPYRAALDGRYRYYSDTWGIVGHTAEVAYTQPLWDKWTFDGSVRYYKQDAADFYGDLFPRRDFANFLARDKELSTFTSITLGAGAAYDFTVARMPWVQRAQANFRYNYITIDYDDFRDTRVVTPAPGAEPLYSLDASVFQIFLSIWF